MACFLVPAAEAVITTVIQKTMEHREAKSAAAAVTVTEEARGTDGSAIVYQAGENDAAIGSAPSMTASGVVTHLSFSHKLKWLNTMLWGGAGLLAFEHIWHGEIIAQFPFLTAASTAEQTAEMLSEMATSGTAMAVLVTLVWGGMVGITHVIETRSASEASGEEAAAV